MAPLWRNLLLAGLLCADTLCHAFNLGTSGAKIFSGPAAEEFGYTVQQASNHEGKWLLVGAPWSGYKQNRKGDIYRCAVSGARNTCDKLHIPDAVNIPDVRNVKDNMCLGLTLTSMAPDDGLMTCGPVWSQLCGSQDFYPGVCAPLTSMFRPLPAFAPAVQACGGPMDIVIVLDGSNSIYPWEPMNTFLQKLIPSLDIGPQSTQVSVIQYAVDAHFEFQLNQFSSKEQMLEAASKIDQKYGHSTNTFQAIKFASQWGFHRDYGGRPGAAKVMVVVTDGESHDEAFRAKVIAECEEQGITRFGIAVLGYYNRNNIDTKNLIKEIKSIASSPTEKFFFNVSEEAALSTIAGALGSRIFNIEGTGKGGDNFNMEMAQVGFSAHYSSKRKEMVLGAVGAYAWRGTVVHRSGSASVTLPLSAFEATLQDKNHSSLLGYAVSTLSDGATEYFVAGAPRSNHSGQVIVYTLVAREQLAVVDSERGKQIGSYFGSVLCPVDVNRDGVTDLLLVAAPMFMSPQKREQGRVYVFHVTKGILTEAGVLEGPAPRENARFGTAISAAPDLNMDGYSDVVVGAPLEEQQGVVYVYNGRKRALERKFSQRLLGSQMAPQIQYFGRSLASGADLNGDSLPDVSVGAYGAVVQLWSRHVAVVTAGAAFTPDKINIFHKPCDVSGRKLPCFNTDLCLSATFRPETPAAAVDLSYTLTLDADLQASRVTSRGLFKESNERQLTGSGRVSRAPLCRRLEVYIQETPDFINSLSLKVEVLQERPDMNPVLDIFSPAAWEFFIPFTKDCGSDEVCVSDLVLKVTSDPKASSSAPLLVSASTRELSLEVEVKNKKENAYNTRVLVSFSANLFYSSVFPAVEGVKCTATQPQQVSCQVGYPALKRGEQMKFRMNFQYSLDQLQRQTEVTLEARSDGTEASAADNRARVSFPVRYDLGVVLSRQSNINYYVAESALPVATQLQTLDDIGLEFNFTVKISTGRFPVSLLYLTLELPSATPGGGGILYVTGVDTGAAGAVSCDASRLVDPLKVGQKVNQVSFTKESLRGYETLDCRNCKCETIKCLLKDMEVQSDYYVKVKTRIWSGTFLTAMYQSTTLTANVALETADPELLTLGLKQLPVVLTISKPGETADVPVGVIVGSVIGGLALLALAVGLLWKFGFFKRKYKQLQKDMDDEGQSPAQADPGVL